MGTVGILNVGAGDTKITFDGDNPLESARAARIVKDMLRRGYALFIEVERKGEKKYERVLEFREDTCEYIIADMDPLQAAAADAAEERRRGESVGTQTVEADPAPDSGKGNGRRGRRAVKAGSTKGVAVARSAGG